MSDRFIPTPKEFDEGDDLPRRPVPAGDTSVEDDEARGLLERAWRALRRNRKRPIEELEFVISEAVGQRMPRDPQDDSAARGVPSRLPVPPARFSDGSQSISEDRTASTSSDAPKQAAQTSAEGLTPDSSSIVPANPEEPSPVKTSRKSSESDKARRKQARAASVWSGDDLAALVAAAVTPRAAVRYLLENVDLSALDANSQELFQWWCSPVSLNMSGFTGFTASAMPLKYRSQLASLVGLTPEQLAEYRESVRIADDATQAIKALDRRCDEYGSLRRIVTMLQSGDLETAKVAFRSIGQDSPVVVFNRDLVADAIAKLTKASQQDAPTLCAFPLANGPFEPLARAVISTISTPSSTAPFRIDQVEHLRQYLDDLLKESDKPLERWLKEICRS